MQDLLKVNKIIESYNTMKNIFAIALICTPLAVNAGVSVGSSNSQESQPVAARKVQGSGPSPFTECGIGAALFKDVYWAAATSNIIWDLGSTAITSAVASPEMCNAKKINTAKLILETLPELEKDVAAGEGQYLAALEKTSGCKAFSNALRSEYSSVVSSENYATKSDIEKADAMYKSVRSSVAATGCATVL